MDRTSTARSRGRGRGQSLVEFALVIPIFLTLLIGFVEFVFVFNGILATDLASRGATLAATEGGTDNRTDCAVLKSVEDDFSAPTVRSNIRVVEIYEATSTGDHLGPVTRYDRGGAFVCRLLDGTQLTLPYTRSVDGYPAPDRCTALRGCGGTPSVDHVGVRIVYRHTWRTPFPGLIASGPWVDIERANVMRMEPEE